MVSQGVTRTSQPRSSDEPSALPSPRPLKSGLRTTFTSFCVMPSATSTYRVMASVSPEVASAIASAAWPRLSPTPQLSISSYDSNVPRELPLSSVPSEKP